VARRTEARFGGTMATWINVIVALVAVGILAGAAFAGTALPPTLEAVLYGLIGWAVPTLKQISAGKQKP
jgi:hypothetical protein